MKKIIILSSLFIFCFSVYANDNFRKEKKALCELIKREYHLWLVTQNEGYLTTETIETSISQQLLSTDGSVTDKYQRIDSHSMSQSSISNYKFSDFEFTIVRHQAIVKFRVDHQLVSAFLEKENGIWKLICAAPLNQPI